MFTVFQGLKTAQRILNCECQKFCLKLYKFDMVCNYPVFVTRCFCHPVKSGDHKLQESEEQKANVENFNIHTLKESADSDTFGTLTVSLERTLKNYQNNVLGKNLRETLQRNNIMKENFPSPFTDENNHYSYSTDDSESCTFGTIAKDDPFYYYSSAEMLPEDDDDDKSYKELPDDVAERNPMKYLQELKQLVKDKKLKDALKLFEKMKQNKVPIIKPIYTFMIGACGRAGYTRMAFTLYRQMRENGLTPSAAALTGLFNACGESPFPKSALKYVRNLHIKMKEKGWLPTNITYHAMIKAYGRCGDIKAAFQIVDEMIKEKVRVTNETFSFLLMACISDKEAGFTLSILVMRKMKKMRIHADTTIFNLFLRAVRECDVGPPELSSQLLWTWKSNLPVNSLQGGNQTFDNIPLLHSCDKKLLRQNENVTDNESSTSDTSLNEEQSFDSWELSEVAPSDKNSVIIRKNEQKTLPNLLASRPVGQQVIGIENATSSQNRLALVGGSKGVIEFMHTSNSKPNLKTFTLLLECIPSTQADELALLEMMKVEKVKPDIDFFNLLIKRRNFRKDFIGAKEVFSLIKEHHLYVDIVTFGVLALGCWKKDMGMELIKNMQDAGFHPNVEIIGAMVFIAKQKNDPWYLVHLMKTMKNLNVSPNPYILQQLESAFDSMKKATLAKERGEKVKPVFRTKQFEEGFHVLCLSYNSWLKEITIDMPQHPWEQYKTKEKTKDSAMSV